LAAILAFRYAKSITGSQPQIIITVPGKAFIPKFNMNASKIKKETAIATDEKSAMFLPNFL